MSQSATVNAAAPAELAEQINWLAAIAAWVDVLMNNNWEDQGQRNAKTLMDPLGGSAILPG